MVNRVAPIYLLIAMSLSCAGGDYQIALPNGYFISRVKSNDFALIAPNGRTVVVRTVEAYMVHEAIVAGQSAPSVEGERLYFIVNTQTNSVHSNLPAPRWKDELYRLGIRSLSLREPKPIHAVRRWFTK